MNVTPLLEGYGVRLEPLSLNHIDRLTPIAVDPSIWQYMPLSICNRDDMEQLVLKLLADAEKGSVQPWVIFVGHEVAGMTSYLDIQPAHRAVEIGFTWLAKPWRASGVNPRVKLLQLTYGFETLQLRRVALKTHHGNVRSQNAMLKLGAQYEGTFRNHMIMPDGSTRHTKWYSIIAEDWPQVKQNLLNRIASEPIERKHSD